MRDKKIDLLASPSTNTPTTRNTSNRTEQSSSGEGGRSSSAVQRSGNSNQQQCSRTTVNGSLQETNLLGTHKSKKISSLTKSKKV
jgi:hypothetical protein